MDDSAVPFADLGVVTYIEAKVSQQCPDHSIPLRHNLKVSSRDLVLVPGMKRPCSRAVSSLIIHHVQRQ